MGKKNNSESERAGKLTDYETLRLKKLESNKTRMKAAGFNTYLSNKEIFNSNFHNYENEEDKDYEPVEERENGEEQIIVQKKSFLMKVSY